MRKASEFQFISELSHVSRERLAGEDLEKEPTYPAREVFETLIRRFDLKAPRLTAEPLEFFAKYLENSLAVDEEDEDFYFIRRALARVREGVRLEAESRREISEQSTAEELLNRVSDAVQRSDYSGAINAVQGTDFITLTPEHRFSLDDALEKVYLGASDPEEQVAACEIRLHLVEASRGEERGHSSDWISRSTKASLNLASALVNKGVALWQAGRTDEELAAYQEVERRFADAPEPALREQLAKALYNKGVALGQAGQLDEAVAAYEQVERRFGDAPEPTLRELVATIGSTCGIIQGSEN